MLDAMLLAESKASGDHRAQGVGDHAHDSDLTPVELFKVSKDLPFRAMCVNHASPTMIAIAASKTIMEVNIRGVLRRYGIHHWLAWLHLAPDLTARVCAGNPDAENGEQGRIAKCLMTRDRKANAISSHPRDSIYATVRNLNIVPQPEPAQRLTASLVTGGGRGWANRAVALWPRMRRDHQNRCVIFLSTAKPRMF